MVIDFHTHIFPDKVAQGAVTALAAASGSVPYADGTRAGLLAELSGASADIAVNLPVLTRPSQFESILRFATEQNAVFSGRGILSFAGLHPAQEDIRAAVRAVRRAGIPGVKIHPEYQDTFIDDEAFYRLLSAAKEEDLIVVAHAGVDAAYRDRPARCAPDRVARVLDRLGGYPKLVLAHLGGNEMWDEVLLRLCGREVYFDTSYVMPLVARPTFDAILARHGAGRILFGTDSPWQSIPREVERFFALGLPAEERDAILYQNAKDLLGL